MLKTRKDGRKKKADTLELRQAYAEFLYFYQLGDMGKRALSLMGYSEFTKKEFCDKHNISIDTPADLEKNSEFKEVFWGLIGNKAYYELPKILMVAVKKGHLKEYTQFVAPEKAKELFAEKKDLKHSGELTNNITVTVIDDNNNTDK